MEFKHIKKYTTKQLTEEFYIDEQSVDEWVYYSIDSDCYEKFKNIKHVKKPRGFKEIVGLFCTTDVKNADDFNKAIANIVNDIKIHNIADGVDVLKTLISNMGNEFYIQGYSDCLHANVEESKKRVVSFIKKNGRRG